MAFLSNLGGILGFLLVLTTGLYLWLVRYRPLTKIQWKYMEYAWLLLTGLGIIGLVENNRKLVAEARLADNAWAIESASRDLKQMYMGAGICIQFSKSRFSPGNLDEIQEQYTKVCTWLRGMEAVLKSRLDKAQPIESVQGIKVRDEALQAHVDNVLFLVRKYNQTVMARPKLAKGVHGSVLNTLLNSIAPILFATGLAIRIAKTAGEIRLERLSEITRRIN